MTEVDDDVVTLQTAPRAQAAGKAAAAIAPPGGRARADHEHRSELQFMQRITGDLSSSHGALHSEQPQTPGGATMMEYWRDRVRVLPEIRSALLPLDAIDSEREWSSAFSLPKADLEPWLSFFKGYKRSSLFAGPVRPLSAESPGQPPALQLQFEVLAILALRDLPAKLILEPPVRIDKPAEYLDLIAELETCSDPMQARALAKIVNEVHQGRLEHAVELGRAMGDRLYHALLGTECINLSKEWQNKYQRKPTVDELYCMLTSGRIKPLPERPHAQPLVAEAPRQVLAPNPTIAKPPEKPRDESMVQAEPQRYNNASSNRKAESVAKKIAEETCKHNLKRKILLHLFHFTVCCAALAAHAFAV